MAQTSYPRPSGPRRRKTDPDQIPAMMAAILGHTRSVHDRLPAGVDVFGSGTDPERFQRRVKCFTTYSRHLGIFIRDSTDIHQPTHRCVVAGHATGDLKENRPMMFTVSPGRMFLRHTVKRAQEGAKARRRPSRTGHRCKTLGCDIHFFGAIMYSAERGLRTSV